MVAAAVCPCPPLLLPELAAGAAGELDDLRAACAGAINRLRESGARSLVVIGEGPSVTAWQPPVTASFAAYGVPVTARLQAQRGCTALRTEQGPLPLSLAVAVWLLRDQTDVEVTLHSLPAELSPAQCARWQPVGADLDQPWALLAMGDGSACRTVKAPGYFDPDAEPFDAAVAAALANADTAALLALDPAEARRLWCAGRPAWQVLAGLVEADGRPWTGELRYHQAPYGVGYFVADLAVARSGEVSGS